ncbi:hypothetical protein Agabi119p4_4782 [Agaricus bisporus var. burnettii]|uniref:AAA+ ATPase domain-containing protein n=1 Tax=Agaricus bisporus var. burnettii TaxID=192524 RepID=A0A8H7F3Y0_AGABI|nr:hypothetical protein Agabi119p4_4782 [Agaricus bisporus var. burnettii]
MPPDAQQTDVTRWPIHVEVRLNAKASARFDTIRSLVHTFVMSHDRIGIPSVPEGWQDLPELASSVEIINICEAPCPKQSLSTEEVILHVHVYQPADGDSFEEFSNDSGGRDDGDTMTASVCELPNKSWDGLWNSLIYADDIKLKMLDYIHATLLLSDASVDFNLVSWNRVVLLYGPPGTGKTSFCRALAQKLSIRLSHRYSHARLLEINSHSLFSKWFSESGKLVQRLFNSINELIEEEDAFVVVLIDEVESLTAARAGAMAGTEPSDGLRVVNALLTQLDKLKHRKNVLIMSTSNLVKAIDSAFIDRADIIQFIDLPTREAIYEILRSCLCEIISKGIVVPAIIPTLKQAQMFEVLAKAGQDYARKPDDPHEEQIYLALRIMKLASQCRSQNMSGRALRRLPVLALSRYLGLGTQRPRDAVQHNVLVQGAADIVIWLDGMEQAIREQTKGLENLQQ